MCGPVATLAWLELSEPSIVRVAFQCPSDWASLERQSLSVSPVVIMYRSFTALNEVGLASTAFPRRRTKIFNYLVEAPRPVGFVLFSAGAATAPSAFKR